MKKQVTTKEIINKINSNPELKRMADEVGNSLEYLKNLGLTDEEIQKSLEEEFKK